MLNYFIYEQTENMHVYDTDTDIHTNAKLMIHADPEAITLQGYTCITSMFKAWHIKFIISQNYNIAHHCIHCILQ